MPSTPSTNAASMLLATSLMIAEFDVDTGACLRACYPRVAPTSASSPTILASPTAADSMDAAAPPGVAGHTEYFANVMLPDGAEKVSVTRTVFVVNRPQPPVFLRFPVYRFCLENAEATRTCLHNPLLSPSPATGGGDAAASRWNRTPGEETSLYVAEVLLINTSNRAVSLKYKGTEIEAPTVVPIENLSSPPSLPADVVRFSKQLEAMLMNEATLSGSRTSSFAAGSEVAIGDCGGVGSSSGGGGPGGRASNPGATGVSPSHYGSSGGSSNTSDYAFVVITYPDSRKEGYLMRVAHFERLLKEMKQLDSAERSAAATAAAAAAVEVSDVAQATPSTSPPPLLPEDAGAAAHSDAPHSAEGGPLGALHTSRPGEVEFSGSGGASLTMTDSLHFPHSESVGESTTAASRYDASDHHGGGVQLPESATPRSPEMPIGPDTYTPAPTTAANATSTQTSPGSAGHLFLPRDDSMNSGSDAADAVAAGALGSGNAPSGSARFADPTTGRATSAGTPFRQTATSLKRGSKECAAEEAGGPALFGLCAVVSKRDSTARRGGITKSVAVLGPSLVWLEPFFPVLVAAAQYCCTVSGTTDEALKELQRILKRCYDSINNAASVVAAGRAKVDQLTAEIGKYCTLNSGQQAYVYYNDAPFGTTIKAKIPLSPEPNDIAFTKYSIETVIGTFGPSSMLLLLGILTEKKILILSRKGEASDVCEVALSLGIIGNMLDRSFMAKKVFPYVSVSSVDHFLSVPGYVVGTLNPIFESVQPWGWDLLCDLDNKVVVTSAERMLHRQVSSSASGGSSGGAEAEALRNLPAPLQRLYKTLVNTIYHLRALRVGAVERNRRLRLVLEDFLYTTVLVGYVAGGSVLVPNPLYPVFSHRSLSVLRLEMMLTSMLDNIHTHVLYPKENPALQLNCAALRQCASGETPVQRTLLTLLSLLETPYDVKLFLRRMALAVGGLNAVGMQLTHPSPDARAAAAALLARVEAVPEGKAAVASMNNFFLMVYEKGVKGARR